ncbi:hypothetical protein Shyhy02_78720 [Streptomyces hygroscopicus subsp. hygroscopicus]|nr:hypothetical protein Shyhy02_78720 [Streptomyces hygroscopicus subsp. hygroscopicus]
MSGFGFSGGAVSSAMPPVGVVPLGTRATTPLLASAGPLAPGAGGGTEPGEHMRLRGVGPRTEAKDGHATAARPLAPSVSSAEAGEDSPGAPSGSGGRSAVPSVGPAKLPADAAAPPSGARADAHRRLDAPVAGGAVASSARKEDSRDAAAGPAAVEPGGGAEGLGGEAGGETAASGLGDQAPSADGRGRAPGGVRGRGEAGSEAAARGGAVSLATPPGGARRNRSEPTSAPPGTASQGEPIAGHVPGARHARSGPMSGPPRPEAVAETDR